MKPSSHYILTESTVSGPWHTLVSGLSWLSLIPRLPRNVNVYRYPCIPAQLECLCSGAWEPGNEANCNCSLQTGCHPHCREMRPALQQNSILDLLQTQLLTTVLCHYMHEKIKVLPSPSCHDRRSHLPHLLGGQNSVFAIGNTHSDLPIPPQPL